MGKKYGKLYNWYAVNDPRGLSPEGWHIPTEEEWVILTNQLGGKEGAAVKIKPLPVGFKMKPAPMKAAFQGFLLGFGKRMENSNGSINLLIGGVLPLKGRPMLGIEEQVFTPLILLEVVFIRSEEHQSAV